MWTPLLIILGVLAAFLAIFRLRRRTTRSIDLNALGTVSSGWLTSIRVTDEQHR
jgi:hypothetical protein